MAMRAVGAWWLALGRSADHNAAALLAHHMAEGTALTLFAHGPSGMGTFEPAVGALACRLLGPSGFAINLGTALLGALLMPVIYLWGRAAGGKRAGCAALLWVVVGPPVFFRYLAWSCGGYAAMLVFATTTLWLTTHIASRMQMGLRVSRWTFLWLGLIAGLGWWTTPLVVGCYAAAVLVWVTALGRRSLSCRLIYLLLGFVLTSAPRWIPHVTEVGAALTGFWTFDRGPMLPALKAIMVERLPDLMGLWHERVVRAAGWITTATLLVLAIVIMVRRWRCAGLRGNALFIFSALAGILLHLVAIALGPFASSPLTCYLLPLVPLLALLLGVATESMGRHLAWGMGWLPLLFLISPHVAQLPVYRDWRAGDGAYTGRVRSLQSELVAEGIAGVYSDYADARGGYGLNFMTGEAVCFVDPEHDYDGPYHDRMERASQVGVLNDYGRVTDLLTSTQGKGRYREVAGFGLHDRFVPPPAQVEIAPIHWVSAIDATGADCLAALSDGRLASTAAPGGDSTGELTLTFTLDAPLSVSGFRLRMGEGAYPAAWQIQGAAVGKPWRDLVPRQRVTTYFWSGTRPYFGGYGYRVEGQFTASEVTRLRLVLYAPQEGEVGAIAEVQWLGPSAPRATTPADVSALREVLQQRDVRHLYADRWLAGQLEPLSEERVDRAMESEPLRLYAWSAMVVGLDSARLCRAVLARAEISVRETRVGPWILFDVAPGAWEHSYAHGRGLVWAGYSCLAR